MKKGNVEYKILINKAGALLLTKRSETLRLAGGCKYAKSMKAKIFLITWLLSYSIICYSQTTDNFIVKIDSICIGVDSTSVLHCLFYKIENNSSSTLYLWIEKDIHSSDKEKIRDYFFKSKGDMSVYQMLMETEITFGCRALYGNFLKKIKSKDEFTIQIVSKEELSECMKNTIHKYLNEHIVIISEYKLKKYIVGVDNFKPFLFYKSNFVTIPVDMIDFK